MGDQESLDAKPPRSRDWKPVEQELARTLDLLEEGQFVIVNAPVGGGAWAFVQFVDQGIYGMRAEATSNTYLPPVAQLDAAALQRMQQLGWTPPTGGVESTPESDPDGSPNYYIERPRPVPYEELACIAVDTLVDVFCVGHPHVLRYEASDDEGAQLVLPGISLERIPITTKPEERPDLFTLVGEVLANRISVDGVQLNENGDFVLIDGSARTVIRTFEDPPSLLFTSPLLTGIQPSEDLMRALNAINARMRWGKVYCSSSEVIAELDLICAPFVPEHVAIGCQIISRFADTIDDELQGQFGGKTFIGDFVPPKETEPYGGYL